MRQAGKIKRAISTAVICAAVGLVWPQSASAIGGATEDLIDGNLGPGLFNTQREPEARVAHPIHHKKSAWRHKRRRHMAE